MQTELSWMPNISVNAEQYCDVCRQVYYSTTTDVLSLHMANDVVMHEISFRSDLRNYQTTFWITTVKTCFVSLASTACIRACLCTCTYGKYYSWLFSELFCFVYPLVKLLKSRYISSPLSLPPHFIPSPPSFTSWPFAFPSLPVISMPH